MENKELNIAIGNRIYDRRRQLNMTQEKLSELTETTPQAISNYERGERELKASVIINIAAALDTTADYLLCGRENTFSIHNNISEIPPEDKTLIFEIVERCIKLTESRNE